MQTAYLKRLANESPERFAAQWEKRVSSWLCTIHQRADEITIQSPAVFAVLDEAMEILKNCGRETFSKYGPETHDILGAECCRAVSLKTVPDLYRLSAWAEP